MKYNTYLFDFDGTLVDSMPTFAAVMTRILDENGIAYGDDIVKIITPLGYLGTARYFKTLGLGGDENEIIAQMKSYSIFEYENTIEAKETVIETLKALKQSGASLNILTASPHQMLDPCLKRLCIYDLFDNVWSCDDFGTSKADPNIYKMAAEKIGVSVGDVLFLDDNMGALGTAKVAGMPVCGVYDPTSDDCKDAIKKEANHYVMRMAELTKI